jgi:hypothetical protein
MKSIKNIKTGKIKRVSDLEAATEYFSTTLHQWKYVSKSEWKMYKNGENLKEQGVIKKAGDVGMTLQNPLKANKPSKSAKRNARRNK